MKKTNSLVTIARITFLVIAVTLAACKGNNANSQQTQTAARVKPPKVDINMAAASGNAEAVKQHIAAGTNINEKDPFGGSSPLISASLFGKTDIVKILLDAGADINFTNNDGSTALHVAAFFCRPDIVKLLLEKRADKTIRNKYQSTAYESVAGPFNQVKPTYEMMVKILEPMGLKLDFTYLEKTRPQIASVLK
jgi:hypothetical protein